MIQIFVVVPKTVASRKNCGHSRRFESLLPLQVAVFYRSRSPTGRDPWPNARSTSFRWILRGRIREKGVLLLSRLVECVDGGDEVGREQGTDSGPKLGQGMTSSRGSIVDRDVCAIAFGRGTCNHPGYM